MAKIVELKPYVNALLKKAAEAKTSEDAVNYSTAALQAAEAMSTLNIRV